MSLSTEEVNELIANGRRVVQEAKEALERGKRVFAELGIDPKEVEEYMERNKDHPEVKKAQAMLDAEIQRIEEETQRRRMHEPKTRAPGQRARAPKNMV
jgi:hypothetical protein